MGKQRSSRRIAAFAAAGLLVLAACSGDDAAGDETAASASTATAASTTEAPSPSTSTDAPTTTAATTTTGATTEAPSTTSEAPATTCSQGASLPDVSAEAVGDGGQDYDVTSFDGTLIRVHWFPVSGSEPSPTVLKGPGFGSSGDVSLEPQGTDDGTPAIVTLNAAGYNVMTWDPRGIGESGGVVSLDGPDYEGRDVQALLDWVAEQPEAQLDGPGDPRAGMVGGSYGGGIQLTLASIDCRVEAIAPGIAWHSLVTSLYPSETVKTGWTGLLDFASAGADRDPRIDAAMAGAATGVIDPATVDWFASRGIGDDIDRVETPAMFLQGTVDTLFPLDEAVANFRSLQARGVPAKMLWFCGGHGLCLTNTDDSSRVLDATMDWLARYVQGDESVDTGAVFDTVDDEGEVWVGDDVPAPGAYLEQADEGGMDLTADGGSGPTTLSTANAGQLGTVVAGITGAPATNAVTVDVPASTDSLVLGAPLLHLEYFGTAGTGDSPTRVFAQLVDVARGVVVGNQVTPIDVVLDGANHIVDIELEMVAQSMAAGETLQLQLTPTAVEFATPQLGGHIQFTGVGIRLPVVALTAA